MGVPIITLTTVVSYKIGKKRVFLKEDLVRWIKEH